ncbi:MAG: hypothetical protein AAF600_14445 [Bacteroidota bacterium]
MSEIGYSQDTNKEIAKLRQEVFALKKERSELQRTLDELHATVQDSITPTGDVIKKMLIAIQYLKREQDSFMLDIKRTLKQESSTMERDSILLLKIYTALDSIRTMK